MRVSPAPPATASLAGPDDATRALALRFLPLLALLVVVLWPLDVLTWGRDAPETRWLALWRLGTLVLLGLGVLTFRRAADASAVRRAWILQLVVHVLLSFGLFGFGFDTTSPIFFTIFLTPFVSLVVVSGLRTRVLLTALAPALSLVAFFAPHPGRWSAYDDRAVLVSVLAFLVLCLPWVGHRLTQLISHNAAQNRRLERLRARQEALSSSVSREMHEPLRELHAACTRLREPDAGDASWAKRIGACHALVTELEALFAELLERLRGEVEPASARATSLEAALRQALPDWEAVHPGVAIDLDVEPGLDPHVERRALLRALNALVEAAIDDSVAAARIAVARRGDAIEVALRREATDGGPATPPAALEAVRRVARRGGAELRGGDDGEIVLSWSSAATDARPEAASGPPSIVARLRALLVDLGPLPALPDFADEEVAISRRLLERFMLFLSAQAVILWPTDWLLFADDPAALRSLALVRLGALGLGAWLWRSSSRARWERSTLLRFWSLGYVAFTALCCATLMPTAPHGSPLLYTMILVPVPTILLVVGPVVRLAVCALGYVVAVTCYALLMPPASRAADGGLLVGQLLFTTVLSVWWGHVIRELLRHAHDVRRQIEQVLEGQRQMLRAISHEVRTPLAHARLRLDRLGESEANEHERRTAVDELLVYVELLEELEQELELYLHHGRERQLDETWSPRELLLGRAEYWRGLTGAIALEGIESLPEVALRGDGAAFVRAVGNLIQNALVHARSRVRVSGERVAEDRFELRVTDDGPGIPEADRERVFEPFARLDGSRARHSGGLGLGLPIVHRIVAQHGGAIRIESAPGGGARVVTTWPLADAVGAVVLTNRAL